MATRVEPKDFQIEHQEKETIEKLYQVDLIAFLQKFNRHNESITEEFINNYVQDQTMVGNLVIPLSLESISRALDLPPSREKYHKGLHLKDKEWTFFLEKNRKGSFNRTKGILREWFNEPWEELVLIIQVFFTCDIRLNVLHLYHIRLLQHIKGEVL